MGSLGGVCQPQRAAVRAQPHTGLRAARPGRLASPPASRWDSLRGLSSGGIGAGIGAGLATTLAHVGAPAVELAASMGSPALPPALGGPPVDP